MEVLAKVLGCSLGTISIRYLGLPLGALFKSLRKAFRNDLLSVRDNT